MATFALCSNALAESKKTNASQKASLPSFINFVPQTRYFAQPNHAIATKVEKVVKETRIKIKPTDLKTIESIYLPVIDDISTVRASTNRAFHHELYFLQGYLYQELSMNEKGLTAYDKSLSLRSDYILAVFRRGMILKDSGRCAEARNAMREFEWRTKELEHETSFLIAECYFKEGDAEKGLASLSKSIKAKPNFVLARRLLVEKHREMLPEITDPAKRAEIEANIDSDLAALYEANNDDRDSALDYAETLIHKPDSLLGAKQVSKGTSIARRIAEKSKYTDDRAVKLTVLGFLKANDFSDAEKTIKKGLAANPNSQSLQAVAKQLELQLTVQKQSISDPSATDNE